MCAIETLWHHKHAHTRRSADFRPSACLDCNPFDVFVILDDVAGDMQQIWRNKISDHPRNTHFKK